MKSKSVHNKWSWLLLVLSAVALLTFGSTRDSGPRTQADRIDAITKVLACPTCSGESVYVSRASAAESIRSEVARQIASGQRSDDESSLLSKPDLEVACCWFRVQLGLIR